MEQIVSVMNLRKKFKNEVVVEGVSFQLEKGAIMGLLGPNGAGKTTILKMLTNLCLKDNGEVIINGASLDDDPKKALSSVGAALDTPSFYNELTAKENLDYYSKLHQNGLGKKVMELIDFVGLNGQENKKVKNYSLGMRQRLALARAMINDPKLIILDEPANGLDPQGMLQLYNLIIHLAKERKTTFIVSSHLLHDMEQLCSDVLILHKGKNILQGKTNKLVSKETNIVDITVEERDLFEKIIADYGNKKVSRRQGNSYAIELGNTSLDSFIRKMVENNIHIKYIAVHKNTLQNLFLALTGGSIK